MQLFKITLLMLLSIASIHAQDIFSFSGICMHPIIEDDKLYIVCQNNSETDIHTLNKNLRVLKTTAVDVSTGKLRKIVTADDQHKYLITQQNSKCIELYDLNLQLSKTSLFTEYCDESNISFPVENHNMLVKLGNGSIIFPMIKKNTKETLVLLFGFTPKSKNKLQVVPLSSLKNFEPTSFIQFEKQGVLCLNENIDNPLNMALISISVNDNNRLTWKPIYKSNEMVTGAFLNINGKAFVSGNTLSNKKVYFYLNQTSLSGKNIQILNTALYFVPAIITFDKEILIYGILKENDNIQIGVYGLVVDFPPRAKLLGSLDVTNKLASTESFIFLENGNQPYALILGDKEAELSTYRHQKWETFSLLFPKVVINENAPTIFKLDDKSYIHYEAFDHNIKKSIFERIEK